MGIPRNSDKSAFGLADVTMPAFNCRIFAVCAEYETVPPKI